MMDSVKAIQLPVASCQWPADRRALRAALPSSLPPFRHSPLHFRRERGFTLIELMISVALALILILGINLVFKSAADTTGLGQAISTISRGARGAERTFTTDFDNVVPFSDAPFFIIHSSSRAAFQSRADMDSDRDFDAQSDPRTIDEQIRSLDLNRDGREGGPGEILSAASTNSRNHRIDRVGFFVRGSKGAFHRQTADQKNNSADPLQQLVNDETSSEAFIWYGHVLQPDNTARPDPRPNISGTGNFFFPGEGNATVNPNNFFASDWILGRMQILLMQNSAYAHIQKPSGGTPFAAPLYAGSIGRGSGITGGTLKHPDAGVDWLIQYSRFDVAEGTIRSMHKQMLADFTSAITKNDALAQLMDYRFNCKPTPLRQDPTDTNPDAVKNRQDLAKEMAQALPAFQSGVTQFVVEYAGDFFTQDANGNITAFKPDGVIDFIYPRYPTGPSNTTPARRIRWYGFPRNVDTGDDDPNTGAPIVRSRPLNGRNVNEMVDVVPVSDVWAGATGQTGGATWERFYSVNPPFKTNSSIQRITPGGIQNYADAPSPNGNGLPVDSHLAVSFTAEDFNQGFFPSMVRIVYTLADGNGRLPEGQTFEFVYSLSNAIDHDNSPMDPKQTNAGVTDNDRSDNTDPYTRPNP